VTNARALTVSNRYIADRNVGPKEALSSCDLALKGASYSTNVRMQIDLEKVLLAALDIAGQVRSYLLKVCSTCLLPLGRL
jgi:hypothetical protein